ncbi:synaptobrevin [Purpureocillium lavendulum]|uniref:Synaptobrevin n=1 Tax=Purpureocillium lavendulum TaxID=1247861 RepID=A0AB34G062_9HYPO|nr:synaptobrevin [Purpureocillium lavendulum]
MQLSLLAIVSAGAFSTLTLASPMGSDLLDQADGSFLSGDIYERSLVGDILDADILDTVDQSFDQSSDLESEEEALPADPADEVDGKGGGGKGARSGKGGKPKAGRKNRVTCKGGMFHNFEKCHTPLSYCSDGHYHPYKDYKDLCHAHCQCMGSGSDSQQMALVELSQLLSRLQQTVLHPTPEREHRLRTSDYERARLEANLEYARAQLLKLEQDALALKAPTRRLELQSALVAHRDTLDTLLDRLADIRQIAADEPVDDDSSDEEDLLADIVPTPSESMDSASAEATEERSVDETTPDPPSPTPAAVPEPPPAPTTAPPAQDISPTTTTPPIPLPTQTSQTLRSRASAPSPTSHTTARAALFANRRRGEAASPQTSTATAEAILDHQRVEQDALSDSILKMAGALKASSQRFSTTLEADKETLGRAGEGMDRTERGMEATRGGMGALRRMTEGKGWWGRMILYAWVYGLMLTLLLVVFVMPKLRF